MTQTIIPPTLENPKVVDFQPSYAGFWTRFWALTIDRFILFIVGGLVLFGVGFVTTIGSMVFWPLADGSYMWEGRVGPLCLSYIPLFFVDWLYFALMESSPWQATFGKRAMDVYVCSTTGERLGFSKASVRYWAKCLSYIFFCFGFLMVLFTSRKQALHDMIAECLVVEGRLAKGLRKGK